MLRRLSIRDLVVIADAAITPPSGLTAITGETGAGKTVLADALGLLLGGAADSAVVRPGAPAAVVEATLVPPPGFFEERDEDDPVALVGELADDPSEIVVARRVPADGRARALVDGQVAAVASVAAAVRELVRFTGQGESRELLSPAAQLAALDAFAGPDAIREAGELRAARRRMAAAGRALSAARARREGDEREREDLAALIEDVEAAGLDPEEERSLRGERERLRHAERLGGGAAAAAAALSGDDGDSGARGALGAAAAALGPLVAVDPALAEPAEAVGAAAAQAEDALLALRGYLHELDAEPGRLEWVEDRLAVYDGLSRRHGPGVEAVLARAAEARERLGALDDDGDALGRIAAEADAARTAARELADRLGRSRREAAPALAEALRTELADLAMPDARVAVRLSADDAVDPPADVCTILLAPNPGIDAAPLTRAASGGELARVLLALNGVAARADAATLVFDEIDAGIGGVTATAVAERLSALAAGRQVLTITHLPQVAARADAHLRVIKGLDAEGRATTRIEALDGEELVAELCRMLGAAPGDAGARRHAEELLARGRG